MKKSPELFQFVQELRSKGLSSKQITQKIKDELGIELSNRTIRNWLKNEIEINLDSVKKLNEQIENTNPFEIIDDNIVIYKKGNEGETLKFVFPINLVEQIFTDYSKYGNNLSQDEIIKKYQLKPEAWNLLKSRLRIYKTSDVLPDFLIDYIEKTKGEEGVEEKIIEVTHNAVVNKYKQKIVKRYSKEKEKQYEEAITKLYDIERFLEMLRDFIDNYNPDRSGIEIKERDYINDTIYTVIGDIHIGKIETDKVLKRINEFVSDIVNRQEKNVKIFCLGDVAETLALGGMHKGQIESMDGPYTFDLIMKVVNIFEDMLIELYKHGKNVEFIGIVANHGRLTEKDYMDYTGELVIYELIKRGLKDLKIKIDYLREVWNTVDTNDFCFILQHGHLGGIKKKTKDILWEFGNNKKHNIILQGHVHHGELEDISNNATRIIVPALAGENVYDKALGLSSYPGYVIIKNRNGKPEITFVRLD